MKLKHMIFCDTNGASFYFELPPKTLKILKKMLTMNDQCLSICPGIPFGCTREPNHDGYHVAHGSDKNPLAFWK
jgi:hypothetical protein